MKRIVGGLTQVFLKRRDWTASVGCKADTGWDKWLQSWSLCVAAACRHEILFVPYDVHLHFLLFTCFSCKILSYLNQIHPNSKRSATYEMERIVGGLTQVFLERRDWTASVGCKADTGWDKWLQNWSLCVAAAEPPWNSLCSIWCPSPLPALHMFLLKDLVILEPNSSKFKTQSTY